MRETVFAPANINTQERQDRVGMIREMSRTGALFHSRSKFAVGERIAITYRGADGQLTNADATVVRAFRDTCEDNMFPWMTAIHFEDEVELAKGVA